MSVSAALPCRISIYEEGGKTILAGLKPTTLLALFDTPQLKSVAQEVEDTIVKIMTEAGLLAGPSGLRLFALLTDPHSTSATAGDLRPITGKKQNGVRCRVLSTLQFWVCPSTMPLTPHVEKHLTAGDAVRDVVIGMSGDLTVPFALVALAAFGGIKGRFTGTPVLRSAFQTALIGSLAAGAAFAIARCIS